MTTLTRMTFEDLEALPEDEYLHELVRGEILRMSPPKGQHGTIEAWLVVLIDRYLEKRAIALGWDEDQDRSGRNRLVGRVASGEFGIRFDLPDDPDQVRGIDVCYLPPEQVARHEAAGNDSYFAEVPVLVAEVISPSETAAYINEKVRDYLAGGAHLVWLLFPKTRLVEVYRPDQTMVTVTASDLLDGGDVLPGFSLRVSRLYV